MKSFYTSFQLPIMNCSDHVLQISGKTNSEESKKLKKISDIQNGAHVCQM